MTYRVNIAPTLGIVAYTDRAARRRPRHAALRPEIPTTPPSPRRPHAPPHLPRLRSASREARAGLRRLPRASVPRASRPRSSTRTRATGRPSPRPSRSSPRRTSRTVPRREEPQAPASRQGIHRPAHRPAGVRRDDSARPARPPDRRDSRHHRPLARLLLAHPAWEAHTPPAALAGVTGPRLERRRVDAHAAAEDGATTPPGAAGDPRFGSGMRDRWHDNCARKRARRPAGLAEHGSLNLQCQSQ